MSDAKKISLHFPMFVFSIGVLVVFEASVVSAHTRVGDTVPERARVSSMAEYEALGTLGTIESSPLAQTRGGPTSTFEIARNEEERRESSSPEGPPQIEMRGHEQPIKVLRRSATPIPRVSNSTRRHKSRHGRPRSHSGHHYSHHRGHRHHSHCGHDEYWDYGDRYESRTLGRSCIYGPKGEVIYKPADIICAPEESDAPMAEPSPEVAPSRDTAAPATPAASETTR